MATGECPTIGESSGIIGSLDHLVQPADRKNRSGRQCGDRSRNDPVWCAFDGARQFCRHGAGVLETMNSQVILIIAAIATVYIVLGILYELRTSADDSPPCPRRCWSAAGAGAVQCPFS